MPTMERAGRLSANATAFNIKPRHVSEATNMFHIT